MITAPPKKKRRKPKKAPLPTLPDGNWTQAQRRTFARMAPRVESVREHPQARFAGHLLVHMKPFLGYAPDSWRVDRRGLEHLSKATAPGREVLRWRYTTWHGQVGGDDGYQYVVSDRRGRRMVGLTYWEARDQRLRWENEIRAAKNETLIAEGE